MTEALEDGVVSDPSTVADYHHRISAETERMASSSTTCSNCPGSTPARCG